MNTLSHLRLVQQIQTAFTNHVLDQFGMVMDEAYLLDNWITIEGFLVNGVTLDGLIYDQGDQGRMFYEWELLYTSTLENVLSYLQEEAFA
ncbi:hypothetical protein [Spirosoma endophyticum]|uniref:Uncharacterized protein n=1 Tax=Spirosoma endophyticum TaxID=662367 RepID=A0A1I2E6A1_9BACT|nr:hypothetical protein [Spirosoma endophyticum]SFE88365.1 hypothetical protein SAMN05216167_12138 [Spirosoma endophyticum]